jgi:uncharacterized protein
MGLGTEQGATHQQPRASAAGVPIARATGCGVTVPSVAEVWYDGRMDHIRTIDIIRDHKDAIRLHGATSLYVFGSRARGDNAAESDLDVFVEYDPNQRFSLFNLVRIKRAIETITGLRADVTTRDSLRADAKAEIESQAVRVF